MREYAAKVDAKLFVGDDGRVEVQLDLTAIGRSARRTVLDILESGGSLSDRDDQALPVLDQARVFDATQLLADSGTARRSVVLSGARKVTTAAGGFGSHVALIHNSSGLGLCLSRLLEPDVDDGEVNDHRMEYAMDHVLLEDLQSEGYVRSRLETLFPNPENFPSHPESGPQPGWQYLVIVGLWHSGIFADACKSKTPSEIAELRAEAQSALREAISQING